MAHAPVRNIGTGAARCLAAVAAFATGNSASGPVESARVPRVVPANQHAVVGGFQDTPGLRALIASEEEIVIEVAYVDISGNRIAGDLDRLRPNQPHPDPEG